MASDPLPCRFCGSAPKISAFGGSWVCPSVECLAEGPIDDDDHAKWDAMMRGGPALAPEDCIEVRGWALVDEEGEAWITDGEHAAGEVDAVRASGGYAYPIRVRLPKPQPHPVIEAEMVDETPPQA